ncbi:MAG: type II secretion system F family protein [Panacagrimonas sp.]
MAGAGAAKEHTFQWEGTDRRGARVKGVVQGASETMVRMQLRRQGVNPIRVRRNLELFSGRHRITTAEVAIFSRQLATMMSAGVALVQSLDIVGRGHDNPAMSELVLGIKTQIESGRSLSEALARYPLHFDELFRHLVDAGERSGTLETLLEKIALYKEKTERIKRRVRKALVYPTAVLLVALIVTGVMLYFVVPQFQSLFEGFGADLPAFTRMVVSLSEFVRESWWVLLTGIAGSVFLFVHVRRRSPALRRALDRFGLKVPVIGGILYKSAVARFSRTLSTLFAAGVPLVEALESVARAAGNVVFEESIDTIRSQVASGQSLQLAMQQGDLFPPMAVQMVAIGEESGTLDQMCAKVAEFYEDEVDTQVDALTSLLEPLIMVILGVLVGGLVVAMYLPIFRLGQAI